jgi:CRP-like cAMP-binding protein
VHGRLQAFNAARNLILRALPPAELEHLLPHLQTVTFSLGQVVYEPGERIEYCYFPTDCVISLLYTAQDGSTAEMGLVGNEGMLGVALFLGGESTCSRAIVPLAGDALRLPGKLLQLEFARSRTIAGLLLRYTQALLTQVAQTAVCNRLHSLEQRLCRWLLLCHDRKDGVELLMTQELIANMLGGRRESVTVSAGHLQDAGLIHYSRGHITIVDRAGLESAACECYRIVENECDRLFDRKPKPAFSKPEAVFEKAG